MKHQHLAVCTPSGADTDDGNGQRLRDAFGQRRGHHFQHQYLRAGLGKSLRVV